MHKNLFFTSQYEIPHGSGGREAGRILTYILNNWTVAKKTSLFTGPRKAPASKFGGGGGRKTASQGSSRSTRGKAQGRYKGKHCYFISSTGGKVSQRQNTEGPAVVWSSLVKRHDPMVATKISPLLWLTGASESPRKLA